MASFNKVLLMGNLTRDPQLSYTPSQTAVVDFGMATNRKWTAQDGSQRDETCFVDCRAFGRMAENLNKFMSKGKPIFIEGRLTYDTWTAQDGTKRSRHRVTVENFQFMPGSGGGGPDQADQSSGGEQGISQTRSHDQVGDDEIPF
jgi:single-strand DNA-binding protein